MTTAATVSAPENSRRVSMRYFCMYRLLIASALAVFGMLSTIGEVDPFLYTLTVSAYWVAAVGFVLVRVPDALIHRALVVHVSIDIIALILLMHADGGYRSGIPYLLIVSLAGCGLVAQGKMVFAFAAAASLAVLIEQTIRMGGGGEGSISRAGVLGLVYFAVAWVSQALGQRAIANEALAARRGEDLARQQRVNARIIEDMQEGVIVIDDSGRVLQFNPGAATLLASELSAGVHLGEVSRELARLAFATTHTEAPIFRVEQNDALVHVRRAQASSAGDTILYLEDMAQVQAQAQQIKLAALGRLTANIAHEIRNPLAAITHASELMLEEKRAEVVTRLVRIVRDNGARIDRIVRDILDLGRRDRLSQERLDLSVFMQGFLEELAMHQPESTTIISNQLPESAIAMFDRGHLHQILGNLVSNACRYCSGAPASVVLSMRRQGERMVFSVADDGPGIQSADRNKIFEPFFTSDPKGTGLGLFIARELAEANGAQLVLGDPPSGSEFRLIARSVE